MSSNDKKYPEGLLNDQEMRNQETYNRINELENLVEKHTRSQRHLEQYSHIGSPENVDHARHVQKEREEQINNLEDKIVYGDGGPSHELENLQKNITFSKGYLNHNADTMKPEDKKNLENKIENQKDTINWLQNK